MLLGADRLRAIGMSVILYRTGHRLRLKLGSRRTQEAQFLAVWRLVLGDAHNGIPPTIGGILGLLAAPVCTRVFILRSLRLALTSQGLPVRGCSFEERQSASPYNRTSANLVSCGHHIKGFIVRTAGTIVIYLLITVTVMARHNTVSVAISTIAACVGHYFRGNPDSVVLASRLFVS